jgi:hypothetical protein
MTRRTTAILLAFLFSLVVPALGYAYLGQFYSLLFLVAYLGGFALWLFAPKPPWPSLQRPFWLTMTAFFVFHKVEETRTSFFAVVSKKITGTSVPEITAGLIIGLLVLPVGAWLSIPYLVKRGYELGYYLIATFFVSMGVTELAHYFLPSLRASLTGTFQEWQASLYSPP